MLSKFFRTAYKYSAGPLLMRRLAPKVNNVRNAKMIPASQYDIPYPNKLKLGYALKVYWETIPLFISTSISLAILICAIIWSFKNKVDVVYTSRSRQDISHTMDLRNPTAHKFILINQRYEPWPEMADVLDKLKMAEKRALMRAQSCSHP